MQETLTLRMAWLKEPSIYLLSTEDLTQTLSDFFSREYNGSIASEGQYEPLTGGQQSQGFLAPLV